jgi:predicted metal-dependent peptidase
VTLIKNTEVADRVAQARFRLTMDHRWLAALLLRLEMVEDRSIGTCATNGRHIRYNPNFLTTLPDDHLGGVLLHEGLHCGFRHHQRRENRDPRRWNIACDICVNHTLREAGIELPTNAVYPETVGIPYNGENVEHVYDLLPESNWSSLPTWGEVEDGDASEESAEEWKSAMRESLSIARECGSLPQSLDRMAKELLDKTIPWREILSEHMYKKIRGCEDYTWVRPSRRAMALGICLPGMSKDVAGRVTLIIDTSKSMAQGDLDNAVSAVVSLADDMACETLTVIAADAAVNEIVVIACGEPVPPFKCKGGGGTDFRPALKVAMELRSDVAVYITDLAGVFPSQQDAPPTIWLTVCDTPAPPWGTLIRMG